MANFLQLTPENIAQAKNMSWGQALKTDLASGFKPGYTGKGATNLGGYITEGVKSLFGKGPTSGGVGGATPLTRKAALGLMEYGPKLMGSQIAYGAPFAYASGASALQDYLEKQGLTGKGGIADVSGLWGAMGAGADVEYDIDDEETDGWTTNFPDSLLTGQNIYRPDIRKLMQNQRFKKQQLMNRRKQDMQQTIRQAEAAAAPGGGQWVGGAPAYTHQGQGGGEYRDTQGNVDYHDPYDPGGGEARGGFIDGTNRRRSYFDGGLLSLWPR